MQRDRTAWRPWWWAAHGSVRVLVAVGALILLASAGVGAILNSGLSALDRGRRVATPQPPTALASPPTQPLVIPSEKPAHPAARPARRAAAPVALPLPGFSAEPAVTIPPVAPGVVIAAQLPTTARALEATVGRQVAHARVQPALPGAGAAGPREQAQLAAHPAKSPAKTHPAKTHPAKAHPAKSHHGKGHHAKAHHHGHPAAPPARHAGR